MLRPLAAACLILASTFVPLAPASAAARTVSVEVGCGSSQEHPLELTIRNRSGFAIVVVLARPFHTTYFWEADETTVEDGEDLDVSIDPPTDDRWGGALVVTNLGVLTPPCDGMDQITVNASRTLASDRKAAAAGMMTIAELAAGRVYDGLWALLHPDAQAQTSFPAMACWYGGFLGAEGIGTVEVGDVRIEPWTWSATGQFYERAATVEWTQSFGDGSEPLEWIDHLVERDGVWRWFLGVDLAWLAGLPTSCALPTLPVAGEGAA